MRHQAPAAECLVYTFKEGLLSAVAHDLVLRVERFTVDIEDDPGGAGARIDARFDAAALRVVGALAGGQPRAGLSAADQASIERSIARDVLDARRFPEIRYQARAAPAAPDAADGDDGEVRRLVGRLSLHGQERPLDAVARRVGERWRVRATIHQPDFGITPYAAMLGALRVKADVTVELSLPL